VAGRGQTARRPVSVRLFSFGFGYTCLYTSVMLYTESVRPKEELPYYWRREQGGVLFLTQSVHAPPPSVSQSYPCPPFSSFHCTSRDLRCCSTTEGQGTRGSFSFPLPLTLPFPSLRLLFLS
jgi:hypothetical protein